MEEKLTAYRARKAEEFKQSKSSLGIGDGLFSRVRSSAVGSTQHQIQTSPSDGTGGHASSITTNECINASRKEEEGAVVPKKPLISPDSYLGRLAQTGSLLQLTLKIILWSSLFGISVCIGFGAVYIIISLFYIIYVNMRSENERVPGEKSAYSVFNPECERIHGTLTAEEIEKGMLYGIGGAMR